MARIPLAVGDQAEALMPKSPASPGSRAPASHLTAREAPKTPPSALTDGEPNPAGSAQALTFHGAQARERHSRLPLSLRKERFQPRDVNVAHVGVNVKLHGRNT